MPCTLVLSPQKPKAPTGPHIHGLALCPLSLQSCQADLVKDNGHKYFLSVLADPYMPVRMSSLFSWPTFVSSASLCADSGAGHLWPHTLHRAMWVAVPAIVVQFLCPSCS
jgi:hypothetical protein